MGEYRLNECGFCGTPTWCEKRHDGRPQCRACKVEKFFDNVLYKPIGFSLIAWQRKVLRDMFGRLDVDTGLRQIERAYISVAKKNGKSFLMGGLPIYHLLMDDERHPKAYGAAAAKEQAGLVFESAQQLVNRNPALLKRLEVIPSSKRIVRRDGGGEYRVISADGDLQDGVGPSLCIFDELHRWRTPKAQTLWNVLTKGTIARDQALVVEITTAGTPHESPICYQEYEYAKRVLSGSLRSDRFYAFIAEADAERVKADPEYWKSREFRVAANPSHEDLGGFLRDSKIEAICDEAIEKPNERNDYLRYHGNIWTSAKDRYIPADAWAACGTGTRTVAGKRCIGGFDLSHTTDLTAKVLLFHDETDDTFDIKPFFFMPKQRVPERERKDKQPYQAWADQGFLTLTEGNTISYEEVADKIKWAYTEFDLEMLMADPKDMAAINQAMDEAGVPHMEQPQGFHLSAAMKFLLAIVLEKRIRHDNHPIMTWNIDCLTAKANDNADVKPVKPNRSTDNVRIDGPVALLNALAYHLNSSGASKANLSFA